MGLGIKNVKLHTNNTFNLKLLIAFFILSSVIPLSSYNQTALIKWVIVLDAGHGGRDPGALGALTREKDITLAIALKTGEYIEKNIPNASVIYTRKTDVFPAIKERAELANKNKADLFISIHANWAASKKIRGTETFVMGPAKNQENLEVAMKENEVILLEEDYTTKYEGFDPKSSESYIMFSLMQNIFLEQSTLLASNIQDQFRTRAARIDRGVKQAGFWVLFMTTMPSVLIETGFITNPDEEKYLKSTEGQEYISSAIYRACRDYIKDIERKSEPMTLEQRAESEEKRTNQNSAEEKINELTFMIQIESSLSRKELIPRNFKGIKDVIEINAEERYKYATGSFREYSDAVQYRKAIESIFPDAFVIALINNKIVPLQEALELQRKNKSDP